MKNNIKVYICNKEEIIDVNMSIRDIQKLGFDYSTSVALREKQEENNDENGKEKTTFDSLEGFRLRIPVSEIKENKINFKAEIIGKMKLDQWGVY